MNRELAAWQMTPDDEEALSLITEILSETVYHGDESTDLIFEILMQCYESVRQGILENGHTFAMRRAASHVTPAPDCLTAAITDLIPVHCVYFPLFCPMNICGMKCVSEAVRMAAAARQERQVISDFIPTAILRRYPHCLFIGKPGNLCG